MILICYIYMSKLCHFRKVIILSQDIDVYRISYHQHCCKWSQRSQDVLHQPWRNLNFKNPTSKPIQKLEHDWILEYHVSLVTHLNFPKGKVFKVAADHLRSQIQITLLKITFFSVTAQLPGANGYSGGKVIFIDTEVIILVKLSTSPHKLIRQAV